MNIEHIAINLENAIDLVQVITEDLEDNFANPPNDLIKARVRISTSLLYVLEDYLKTIMGRLEQVRETKPQPDMQ